MKEVINFKQQREIGAIITDIFKFIRVEGKTLFSLILKITGPALLAMIGSYVYYMQTTLGDIEKIIVSETLGTNTILSVFLLLISAMAFYALIYGTVLGYIKSYIQTDGSVNPDDVSSYAKSHFFLMIGLNLLIGIITAAGIIFCVIPGIYLGVCLAMAYPIFVFERNDIGLAISNSFKLIKDEWWITFATFIVIYLLYYLITFIFQVPQLIYYFSKGFLMSEEISADPFAMIDWFSITLDVIAMLAQYLLFTIVIIAIAFIYFNLNEKKNFTGTLESINQLGES
ncbi:hypothetical protein [Planktosalinus lacus]|uniref:Glycerophosphoryl diester phosphodiesterase membrane domain-containing protein n=1 Tax=Planktosalinus lacus TaxID=1526573 RepID=A0A8J2VAV6_9FLAO|nr:hypothetical protein [Planktosalinus lacus]GGD98496.1 hypothetical protein GCM10011312_22500 [Planktosalinus lacus]